MALRQRSLDTLGVWLLRLRLVQTTGVALRECGSENRVSLTYWLGVRPRDIDRGSAKCSPEAKRLRGLSDRRGLPLRGTRAAVAIPVSPFAAMATDARTDRPRTDLQARVRAGGRTASCSSLAALTLANGRRASALVRHRVSRAALGAGRVHASDSPSSCEALTTLAVLRSECSAAARISVAEGSAKPGPGCRWGRRATARVQTVGSSPGGSTRLAGASAADRP
jgi:hypothetical protein